MIKIVVFQSLERNKIMRLIFLFALFCVFTSCENTKKLTLADKAKVYTYAFNYQQQKDCKDDYINVISSCIIPLDTFNRKSIIYYDFILTDCQGNNKIPCKCSFTGFGFNKQGEPVRIIKHHKAFLEFDYESYGMDIILENLKEKVLTSRENSNSWLLEYYANVQSL